MKKRIEKYFPAAMSAIKNILQKEFNDKGKDIPREFQAYAAAFGSSVLQMGLLPTLAVHADKDSGATQSKDLLLLVLAKTLYDTDILNQSLRSKLEENNFDLYRAAVFNDGIERELREHLLDAIVAVKLCLRTFKLSK